MQDKSIKEDLEKIIGIDTTSISDWLVSSYVIDVEDYKRILNDLTEYIQESIENELEENASKTLQD